MSEEYAAWTGPVQTRRGHLTGRLVGSYRASLMTHLAELSPVPLGIHWWLSSDIDSKAELGEDGYPEKGGFLSPIRPSRRWEPGANSSCMKT